MTVERHDPDRPDDPDIDPEATMITGGTSHPADHERPGTLIGNYKLVRALGEGGFGTVFLAEQLAPVKRRVALKIIKLGMDTRQVITRFEAEKQALALMDHPGIAKVYDAGATETGRPYFVMELVEGVPLTEYCDRNRLRMRERLQLFTGICAAVQHAHQKGVIHRDIKPSNVLVTEIEGRPVPKVIDFGIAKATDARLTEQTFFTLEAQFIGTPAYMSPEQAGAFDQDIDTRSDIYSLGVLLYELLTGVTPYDDAKLRSAGFAEIQRIIREDDPMRPSTRVSRLGEVMAETADRLRLRGPQLVKRLRGELDWIVLKCLEKDRARRYETANGLARDVERFLCDEPVVASPPSRSYRLRKLIVRNRAVFAAGAVMALLLAAGVLGTGIGLVRARQAEREAVAEATKANQVAVFLKDMLAGAGPSAARGRDTEMLEEILQETEAKIGDELADQPEVEGVIRAQLGVTYYDLGRLEKSKEQYEMARDLLTQVHGKWHQDVARQYGNLGQVHEALQEFDEAEASFLEALEIRRVVFADEDHEDLAMNLVYLANTYVTLRRFEEAEPLLLEGLERLRRLKADDDEIVAICLNSLGNLMQHLKRYDEAGPYYEEALAVHTEILGDDHPFVITDIFNLAWLAMNTGDMEGAADRFAEVAALARRVYQEPHPNLVLAISGQATAAQRGGRPDEAEPLFREGVAVAEELYGPDHASTAVEMLKLGECLSDLGRTGEADELSLGAIEILEQTLGADHPKTMRSQYNYAYSVFDRGDAEQAIPLLETSVASYTAAVGRDHDHTALVLSNLGRALRDVGRLDESIDPMTECRDIRARVHGAQNWLVGVSSYDLASVCYLQGSLEAADAHLTDARTVYAASLDSTHRAYGALGLMQARVDLARGRVEQALASVDRGRAISVAAVGQDHREVLGYDAAEGVALAIEGDLATAAQRAGTVEPKLDGVEPLHRSHIQLDLGRIRTMTGDYRDAERLLLAAHGFYADEFGGGYWLTRQTEAAVIAMYDAWAEAGSPAAAAAANDWRQRRS